MRNKTKKIIKLHKRGKSTAEIAQKFDMKKNTVINLLRYWNELRQSLGVDTEKRVLDFMRKKGCVVKRMRGDNYFDAFVDGKLVDVKSASLSMGNKKTGCTRYCFEINHKESVSNNLDLIDYFLLVFKDGVGETLYKLNAERTTHLKHMLTFPSDPLNSRKYPLEFVGYL